MNIFKKSYYFFSYCPLQILALKTCNQDISKTVRSSSFELGLLIEDNEKITWSNFFLKKVIFSSYCPLQILALKTFNQDISKIIKASSFKHGQLTDDDE